MIEPERIVAAPPHGGAARRPRRSRPRYVPRGIAGFIVWRVMHGVLTLFGVSLIIFLATQALPGDAASAILGRNATPQSLAALRTQLGLDASPLQQYLDWLRGLATGDFGQSLTGDVPVTDLLRDRLVNSLTLVVLAGGISIPLSLAIGAYAAVRRDGVFDTSSSIVTLVLAAVPEFIAGVALIIVFATSAFHVLPAVTFLSPGQVPWSTPRQLVLPVATLVIAVTPYIARLMRASMVEVLQSDYIEAARLKGLTNHSITWRHAAPNALGPALQAIALTLSYLAGGIVVVEYLFNYPGIGQAFQSAVATRDLPTIQAIALLIASIYVVANLAADVATILVTPRLRTRL
ncbi:MAG: peptide/nickel transport system permease protein [Gaiellales bacterium]|nr:peptide/nickel transport system permease protein [Gaiellales bacterium]